MEPRRETFLEYAPVLIGIGIVVAIIAIPGILWGWKASVAAVGAIAVLVGILALKSGQL